jgi:two-component system CheB/CheR fusion protein
MLLLGSAESTGRFNDLFEPLDRKSRIFRKKATMTAPDRTELPVTFQPIPTGLTAFPDAGQNASSLKTVADEFILQRFSPAAVLVSEDGDILYVSGRTGNFLEPASGRANWNIFAMAREGLRLELAGAFPKVVRQRRIALLKDLRIGMNGGKQLVDVTLQPLESPPPVRGMVLIVFSNVRAHVAPPARAKSLRPDYKGREFEQEMLRVQEDLATAREEMQTSQEELKSANEELQSTNEELQSTNEELTTSKEEMQSLNEELQLVNAELQSKIDELLGANEDLKNLLDSTDIATVFLNGDLLVRRFTTQATSIFRLIPSDVGRPITDIASSLNYKDLAADVKQVLSSFVFLEKEVAAWDDRGFRVRIMPQSSGQGQIEGVVITFMDITAAKALEAEIRERDLKLRTVFEAISEGIVFQDQERRVTFVNSAAERIFGQTFEQIEQQPPADPRWQAIYEDGSPVPEEAHPSVVAFRTGMQEKGRLGILDPTSGSRVWVNVTATPVCPAGEVRPKQVFTVFERIAECTEKLARKQVEGHEEEGRAIGRVKAASRKTTA